jgi:hypothetical protein
MKQVNHSRSIGHRIARLSNGTGPTCSAPEIDGSRTGVLLENPSAADASDGKEGGNP